MNLEEKISMQDSMQVGAVLNPTLVEHLSAPWMTYSVDCVGPDNEDREEYLALLWQAEQAVAKNDTVRAKLFTDTAQKLVKQQWVEVFDNLVTNVGRNDVLDKYFKGSSYTAAWYMGLKGTGSAAAGDTLASHAGWSEVTPYSGNRKAITWGTTSSQSNTASAVSFAITGTATVAGAFISSVDTGTSGILYSAGDFAASRSVANGDTLNVTPTVTA